MSATGLDLSDYTHLDPRNSTHYAEAAIAPLADIEFRLRIGSIMDAPFPDESFDVVFSYWTFPYLRDKLTAIAETHRILRSGGTAILDVTGTAQGFSPSLAQIVEAYPNDGQWRLEETIVSAPSGPRRIERLVIEKRSETFTVPAMVRMDPYPTLETCCHYPLRNK